MRAKARSIEQIIEEQVQRWKITRTEEKKKDERISVITISREAGSGGNILAKRLSDQLEFDLFYQEFIHTFDFCYLSQGFQP
jgi:hypothetical protein